MLYVLLRFTASDYPFDIFKLFFIPVYYILFQFQRGCIMWHSLIRFYIPWAYMSSLSMSCRIRHLACYHIIHLKSQQHLTNVSCRIRHLACYHIIHLESQQHLTNVSCRIRNLECYHIIHLKSIMDGVSHSVRHNNIWEDIFCSFLYLNGKNIIGTRKYIDGTRKWNASCRYQSIHCHYYNTTHQIVN